jgi:beta-glucosidase
MSAYNKINGEYAHENRHLLMDILRDEWGFDGAVISDWGGVNDVVNLVKNGGTLEMPGGGFDSARQIVEAVENGELSEQDLDARVDEIIELVLSTQIDADVETTVIANETVQTSKQSMFNAHHALARKAAEKSIVLLKNEDNILPLKKGETIAVIGEFARNPRFQGSGSSQVNAVKVDNTYDVLCRTELDVIGFAAGYEVGGVIEPALVDEALQLAEKSDVVLMFAGLDDVSESEGIDRETLSLPGNQKWLLMQLAKINKKIVVVLTAGSVVEMSWLGGISVALRGFLHVQAGDMAVIDALLDGISAVLHGFLHGQAGATAIVDALVGKINPSGKLAETYPIKLEDTPTFDNYPSEEPLAIYR